jgi:hypothetical protein
MPHTFRIRKHGFRYLVEKLDRSGLIKSYSLHPKKIFMLLDNKNPKKMDKKTRKRRSKKANMFGQEILSEQFAYDDLAGVK